jgi:hypothetical protein
MNVFTAGCKKFECFGNFFLVNLLQRIFWITSDTVIHLCIKFQIVKFFEICWVWKLNENLYFHCKIVMTKHLRTVKDFRWSVEWYIRHKVRSANLIYSRFPRAQIEKAWFLQNENSRCETHFYGLENDLTNLTLIFLIAIASFYVKTRSG